MLSTDGSADESKQDVVDDVNAVLPTDESVDVSSEADLSDIDPKIDDFLVRALFCKHQARHLRYILHL